MDIAAWIFTASACVYGIAYLYTAARTEHFLKTVALSSLAGLGAFAVVSLLSPLTGVTVAFNLWTLLSSIIVGLPGVISMLFAQIIII